jgi:predicted RNA-binding protein with PIN domain
MSDFEVLFFFCDSIFIIISFFVLKQHRNLQFQNILYPASCILYPADMPYWFDGNNLIGQSAEAAKTDTQTRRAFLSALSTYHKSGGGRFLVYFDGDDPCPSAAPPGVSVRYSAPESADALILRCLRERRLPAEVIIVTNDRELMARCRNGGAAVLDWRQFMAKMQSRPMPQPRDSGDSRERVDVADWMRYFGLDKREK